MSKELVNAITQKLYINSRKFTEIASKANGPHKNILLRKAKKFMERSNKIAAMV